MESTELIPLDGDVAKITKRAEEFKDLHESLQRNLQTYLTLTMDSLAEVHRKAKSSAIVDVTQQVVTTFIKYCCLEIGSSMVQTLNTVRKKSRSLMVFAGILKYRMSPDVYSYLARLDVEIAL
jgi:nuclear pore complex protein Nup93